MGAELVVPHSAESNVRRWPRYKLDIPVRVLHPRTDKTVIVQARGNELNEGGLAVFAGLELSVGEEVAVEFTPPYSGQPIRVSCIVRSRNGYTYGMQLLTDTEENRESATQMRSILKAYGALQK